MSFLCRPYLSTLPNNHSCLFLDQIRPRKVPNLNVDVLVWWCPLITHSIPITQCQLNCAQALIIWLQTSPIQIFLTGDNFFLLQTAILANRITNYKALSCACRRADYFQTWKGSVSTKFTNHIHSKLQVTVQKADPASLVVSFVDVSVAEQFILFCFSTECTNDGSAFEKCMNAATCYSQQPKWPNLSNVASLMSLPSGS